MEVLTLLAMHSCNALAESLQAPMLFKSFELAQHANIVANSAAQGAAAASFFGLTLSLFNFILSVEALDGDDDVDDDVGKKVRVELGAEF